jgi:hypothetical protein
MAFNLEKFFNAFPALRNVNLAPNKKFSAFGKNNVNVPLLEDRTVFWNGESPLVIDGVALPLATLVTFKLIRKIILTEVQGRDGTVKETSNLGDYEITIQGMATAHEISQQGFPTLWQDTFRSLMQKSSQSLEVKNDILNTENVRYIVLKSYDFKTFEGVNDSFGFQMEALSDDNIELELWEK